MTEDALSETFTQDETNELIDRAQAIDDLALDILRSHPILSAALDEYVQSRRINYLRPAMREILILNRDQDGFDEVSKFTRQADEIYWRVVMSWQKYAKAAAAKAVRGTEQIDDVYHIALQGLFKATQCFDSTTGWKFATYATHQMDAIVQRRHDLDRPVNMPWHVIDVHHGVLAEMYAAGDGDLRAAAERAGVDPDKAQSLSNSGRAARLDAPVGDSTSSTLGELMAGDGLERLVGETNRKRAITQIRDIIGKTTMPDTCRQTMLTRLGLNGAALSLEAVAAQEGLTRQAIDLRFNKGARLIATHLGLPHGPVVRELRTYAKWLRTQAGDPPTQEANMKKPDGLAAFLGRKTPPAGRNPRGEWMTHWVVKVMCLRPGVSISELGDLAAIAGFSFIESSAYRWKSAAQDLIGIESSQGRAPRIVTNQKRYRQVCEWYKVEPLLGEALQAALRNASTRKKRSQPTTKVEPAKAKQSPTCECKVNGSPKCTNRVARIVVIDGRDVGCCREHLTIAELAANTKPSTEYVARLGTRTPTPTPTPTPEPTPENVDVMPPEDWSSMSTPIPTPTPPIEKRPQTATVIELPAVRVEILLHPKLYDRLAKRVARGNHGATISECIGRLLDSHTGLM